MLTRRLLMATGGALLAKQAAAAVEWTIVTEYPRTAIAGEGIELFANMVSEHANGALHVQPRFDAPGGLKSAGMLDAVANGAVTAAEAFAGALGGANPIFALSSLPFVTSSASAAVRLLTAARPTYQALLAARGLTLLYASQWPPTGLWSRVPITNAAELKGLRVRTYDAASTMVMQAAGANPKLLSFADALPLLRADTLDAVLSSGDGGAGVRLWETLPHFTVLDYAFPLSLAFCAERTLADLSAPLADIVQRAAAETQVRQFRAMTTRVQENEARMRQNGVTIADAPAVRAALRAAAEPVIAAWKQAAGAEGRAILQAYGDGQG